MPFDRTNEAALQRAAALLEQADALIVAAGAGIGVDSGLPDFRGEVGFWKAYPALGRERIEFASIASPSAFRSNPERAWGFYGHRLALYRQTVPHAGFAVLRRWAAQMRQGGSVFTSNVDGQFHQAGFDPSRIHECHGSIHHLQCLQPCTSDIWAANAFQPDVDVHACQLRNAAPTCPHCGGPARPIVLMFRDDGWVSERTDVQERRQDAWLSTVSRPLVIELGAGTAIPSVRHFGDRIVEAWNGRRIRINPREHEVSSSLEVGLAMGALAGLNAIEAILNAGRGVAGQSQFPAIG
ncbi:MAG: NAD-dependent deacetylase [Pseudorhodobacter sp.]|nr:NAD-dependent deacetylase [Pseudorhodobacter sp.]